MAGPGRPKTRKPANRTVVRQPVSDRLQRSTPAGIAVDTHHVDMPDLSLIAGYFADPFAIGVAGVSMICVAVIGQVLLHNPQGPEQTGRNEPHAQHHQ